MAGFDFPIGLPSAYAAKAGITQFLTALPKFGHAEWADFYSPADDPSQISLHRPFYPARPGNRDCTKRVHLEQGMDLAFSALYRLCEMAHENRRPACPLFWTLGAQQVGKAAITAWQSLLGPALSQPASNLVIWPFSGSLRQLCRPGHVVVVETYPAEFYGHVGLSFADPVRRSKRRRADRLSFSTYLISWANEHDLTLASQVAALIRDGFGSSTSAEDQFDALVGLYGMINVIMGQHSPGETDSPVINSIEGWIFGQDQPDRGLKDG